MFIFSLSSVDGWFYTPTFYVYQKVNKGCYCYVSRSFGFYKLQMYERGTASMCILEVRSKDHQKLFQLGEEWLNQYNEWDMSVIVKNPHYIGHHDWSYSSWI